MSRHGTGAPAGDGAWEATATPWHGKHRDDDPKDGLRRMTIAGLTDADLSAYHDAPGGSASPGP